MDELNARLEETRQVVRQRQHLLAMKKQAQESLAQSLDRQRLLRRKLDEEQNDVDRLEGLTVTNLFATICSTKNERLQKEKEELLEAVLKHDEATEAVQAGQQEVDRLIEQLKESVEAESRYEKLLETKAQAIADASGPEAERLLMLTEQIADLKSDENELLEAINAGEMAKVSLRRVAQSLDSAAGWGTFDLFGGGAISTMVKHSKLDDARSAAHRAQNDLRRFQAELHDAGTRLAVSIRIDGFSTFADYFFDGLIADWMVQSKINSARSACQSTISQTKSAIHTCWNRLHDVKRQRNAAETERREFLESR